MKWMLMSLWFFTKTAQSCENWVQWQQKGLVRSVQLFWEKFSSCEREEISPLWSLLNKPAPQKLVDWAIVQESLRSLDLFPGNFSRDFWVSSLPEVALYKGQRFPKNREKFWKESLKASAPVAIKAHMFLARLSYEKKDWEQALWHYRQIPRESSLWFRAQEEASWTFLSMGLFQEALGATHTLQAPRIKEWLTPESYRVRAITLLKMCRFQEARESLKNLAEQWLDYISWLSILAEKTRRFEDFSSFLPKLLHLEDPQWIPRKEFLKRNLLGRQIYKNYAIFQQDFQKESLNFASLPEPWPSKLFQAWMEKKKELEKELHDQFQRDVSFFLNSIKKVLNEADLIAADILNGEKRKIQHAINFPKAPRYIGGLQPWKLDDHLEYWPFNGEYWSDELGWYVYNYSNLCEGGGSP